MARSKKASAMRVTIACSPGCETFSSVSMQSINACSWGEVLPVPHLMCSSGGSKLKGAAQHGGESPGAAVTKTPIRRHGMLDEQFLQRPNRRGRMVIHIVRIGAREKNGVSAIQA